MTWCADEMLLAALIAVSAWSDSGGFVLGHGGSVSINAFYGADVLPARVGGEVVVTMTLVPKLDVQLRLGGGAETTQNDTLASWLGLRWGVWQREKHGVVVGFAAGAPIGFIVANEVNGRVQSLHVQAAALGMPAEMSVAYSYLPVTWFELGGLAMARVFPAFTGEVSGGGGLGVRAFFYFKQQWFVGLTGTARLELTTYPSLSLRIGPSGQLFFIPAATLSGGFKW